MRVLCHRARLAENVAVELALAARGRIVAALTAGVMATSSRARILIMTLRRRGGHDCGKIVARCPGGTAARGQAVSLRGPCFHSAGEAIHSLNHLSRDWPPAMRVTYGP